MNDAPPPVPTGRTSTINVSGMLFMWENEQPVLVHVAGDPRWCLPVFSTKGRLVLAARLFDLSYDRIKQIEDHTEFLASIWESDPNVLVIIDPRKHGKKVRYALVKYEGN